uniref:Uncharacterized protein n=1 Tax=Aegilops tauschii subsp. strangulata TaxID=200361 RepID=A0A453P5Y5_AEGTS
YLHTSSRITKDGKAIFVKAHNSSRSSTLSTRTAKLVRLQSVAEDEEQLGGRKMHKKKGLQVHSRIRAARVRARVAPPPPPRERDRREELAQLKRAMVVLLIALSTTFFFIRFFSIYIRHCGRGNSPEICRGCS